MGVYIRAKSNKPIAELIEPSTGRTIELKVVEEKEFVAGLYMEQLMDYADALKEFGARWTQSADRTIKIVFPNEEAAENTRQFWRKKSY